MEKEKAPGHPWGMPRGLLSVPEWGLSLCSMSSPGPSSPDGAGGKSTEPTKSQFFRPMQKGRMTFSQGLLSMLSLGSARKRRSSFSLPRRGRRRGGGFGGGILMNPGRGSPVATGGEAEAQVSSPDSLGGSRFPAFPCCRESRGRRETAGRGKLHCGI